MPTSQKTQNIKFEAIHNSPKDEQENIAVYCTNQLSIYQALRLQTRWHTRKPLSIKGVTLTDTFTGGLNK
jgi:hypothetical protein